MIRQGTREREREYPFIAQLNWLYWISEFSYRVFAEVAHLVVLFVPLDKNRQRRWFERSSSRCLIEGEMVASPEVGVSRPRFIPGNPGKPFRAMERQNIPAQDENFRRYGKADETFAFRRDSLPYRRLARDEHARLYGISTWRNEDPIRKDNRSPRPRNAATKQQNF